MAFATPDQEGAPAKDGSQFVLHDQPKPEWLDWQPVVRLAPAATPIELAEGFTAPSRRRARCKHHDWCRAKLLQPAKATAAQ